MTRWRGLAVLVTAFLLAYLPDVGHGFLRDDFMWIHAGELTGPGDLQRILGDDTGFYRPAVTLSFGIDRLLFGLQPLPYALTNVALALACAALIARLAAALGLARWAAWTAAALWAFNLHGVNMALLWLSGRTALLLSLFALAAAGAAVRQRWWQAGAWGLLALLSKEEALILPLLLAWWSWYSDGARHTSASIRTTLRRTAPLAVAVAVYVVLRLQSGAFGPADAPDYYQFTPAPALVLRNIVEYADRAATFTALVSLLALALTRARPHWTDSDRRVLLFCLAWTVGFYALTVFLPLRSSLYALCPSIGVAMAGALLVQRLAEAAPGRARTLQVALLVVLFLLLPIYRQRNVRWVEPADAARRLTADLAGLAPAIPLGATLLVRDTADQRLDDAFSGLFADAVTLYVGRGVRGQLIAADGEAPADGAAAVWLSLRGGRLMLAAGPEPRR